jgi:methylglutaconyl-CoA hydratase
VTILRSTMPPRLTRFAALPIRAPPTISLRVKVARYSTAPEDAVIQTQYVPAPGSGNIRVLLLNRPNARNALSRNLLTSLAQHVQSISSEGGNGPTRALVIGSNTDTAFCAGADLKERLHMSKDECVLSTFSASCREVRRKTNQLTQTGRTHFWPS